jgi:endonuclease I
MKRITLFLSLLLVGMYAIGQAPAGYYSTATGLSGTPLRSALHDIIDNHSVKSYSSLLGYYQTTDKKANGKVWDMYSDKPGMTPPYEYSFGQTCGNYSKEGDCYNREHSFPKSWFADKSPMVSDLYHIVPTDGKVNGMRSNYPYGEVSSPTFTSMNGSKLGPNTFPGYTGTVFEPIDEYKGDFARNYFYMCTRYYTEDNGWQNNGMINGAELKPWAMDLMKKWHQQDPVSAKEIARNNAVYAIQGNRNPFIDHPEYVCMIWTGGTYCSIFPTVASIVRVPSVPGIGDAVSISAMITDDGSITSVVLKWGTSPASLSNTINMTLGTNNTYTSSQSIPGQADGVTIYYQISATDNANNVSNSQVFSYGVGTPMSAPPVVASITSMPGMPTSADAVTITANITDDGTVSSASLVWGTNGTTFPNQINMTKQGSVYQTVSSIPSQSAGTVVSYKISAIDDQTQTTTSPVQSYTVKAPSAGGTCATDLFFSEYLEGSSNNKYLEIYNGTGATVDLSAYKVVLYSNGATTATQTLNLTGTLATGQVLVIKNSAGTVYTGPGVVSNVTFYNGDDAVALQKVSNSAYVDIIGRVGEDPGTAWTAGNIAMNEQTLVRKSSVFAGVTVNPASGFPTLATEWDSFPQDDATHLGSHTMNCPVSAPTITTSAINGTLFCVGAVVNVPFSVSGSINQGNTYTAQLSDANGNFNNPVNIGTLQSNLLNGNISAALPFTVAPGTGYRIRVTASNPAATGTNNGTNLTIKALPAISAGNDAIICKGEAINLTATGGVQFSWEGFGDTSTIRVMPDVTTSYIVTGEDANGCQNSDTITVFVTVVNTPVISQADNWTLSSSAATGNQWYTMDGPIQGAEGQSLSVSSNGIYFVMVTENGCLSDSSNFIRISNLGVSREEAFSLKVMPNPNQGLFTVAFENTSASRLSIVNVLGQQIMSKEYPSGQSTVSDQIDLSQVGKGIYWITIQNGQGSVTRKLVIR